MTTTEIALRTVAVRVVVDNARYAWDNSSQLCMAALPEDFVGDYRHALDSAAVAAMETELRTVWAEHGYCVAYGSWKALASPTDRRLPDDVYHEMWDEAASRLDAFALVDVADLNGVLAGYREGDN